ncbi:MAG: hypothetical protein LC800_23255 [Acidobacteria bacterium]|nr:hypothetical protein [Acidobacteriota bacterium]
MLKCLYCARPLRGLGLRCRACRRYVLRWPHMIALSVVALAVAIILLELLFRVV